MKTCCECGANGILFLIQMKAEEEGEPLLETWICRPCVRRQGNLGMRLADVIRSRTKV